MSSVFVPVVPGGVFGLCADEGGPLVTLAFHRKQVALNSAGETVLSFLSTVTVTCEVQPMTGTVQRLVHGQLAGVNYLAILPTGIVDVREFDRCAIYGDWVEVGNVRRWGNDSMELDLILVR